MRSIFRIAGVFGLGAAFLLASSALADKVKLKDGRVIEGTVIPQGTGYWVKGTDGQTYKLTKEEVVSVEKAGSTPATATPGTKPGTPGAVPKVTVNFNVTKSRCTVVESALAAVTIWQQFLDNAPENSPDLPAAKEEHAKWKALADGGAEKIKGKWVGGDERKAILAKAGALQKEADELMKQSQTLQAVKKFEEAAAVYPNSFESNFQLAYIYMIQHDEKKAADWFAKAALIRPDAPEVLANQGLLHCVKPQPRYDLGIPLMNKALQKGDRREIVHNLIKAISDAPEVMRRRADIKEAEGAARLLASKYDLSGPPDTYLIVPMARENRGGRGGAESEAMWSGTGFIVAADGLILTNRHVVEGAKTLMVVLKGAGPGGSDLQRSCEVVVIDDQQDLALVRIKVDAKTPLTIMHLAPTDSPGDGAECTVIGFPMIDRLGASVKITRGIVSSAAKRADGPDIMIDAKVNPGNSGGPILDRFGNVMAIVSMKTVASRMEDSYGLGISAGMVRRFLAKNTVTLKPGATDGKSLSAEEIAAKAKPSTVCILATK